MRQAVVEWLQSYREFHLENVTLDDTTPDLTDYDDAFNKSSNNVIDGEGHEHDSKGLFTEKGKDSQKPNTTSKQVRTKAGLGRKQDLHGKRISRKELGTIKTDLFKNYNEEEAVKGDEYYCKTAKYRYIIRLNEDGNLANFSPIWRWKIK